MALALLDRGENVVVLDNLSTGLRACVPASAAFVAGDVGDAELLKLLRPQRLDRNRHVLQAFRTLLRGNDDFFDTAFIGGSFLSDGDLVKVVDAPKAVSKQKEAAAPANAAQAASK